MTTDVVTAAVPESPPRVQFGLATALLVPGFWLAAAVPSSALGYVLVAAAVLVPALQPRLAPLLLLTSSFFYSTMAIGSTFVYSLRAYWIGLFLAWFLLVQRSRVERHVWTWIATIATLLAWGTLVATVRLGQIEEANRLPVLDAAVTMVWVLGAVVGWAWLRPAHGRLSRAEIAAIMGAWLVAIGYGVAQVIFGVTEATVPADIWPHLEGFRQYEDMGRHPFASLTTNGMAAVSITPVVLWLAVGRDSMFRTATGLLLAALVGVLTLTRSYLMLLVVLMLLLRPLLGTRTTIWVPLIAGAAGIVLYALSQIDPELLSLSLRLEGDVSSLRADIWQYTLGHLTARDWLLGMGFGTGVWERFFAPMVLLKELASPHTAMLEVVGQFGVVGLAVYFAIGWTVIRAYRANRHDPVVAAVSLALLLVLARELLAASYVFSASILGSYFWILFGMVLAQLPRRTMP